MPDIDNVDMGSGLFMPFYFSYPYRFNYGFLKNYFYPFGFSRGYKTAAERSKKQLSQSMSYKTTAKAVKKQFLQSTESFNPTVFSVESKYARTAQPKFFTADFEKALYNTNWEAQKSVYERYFKDISKYFSLINKTSDIVSKNTDYQKSYLYSNMEAFEKNYADNLAKDLYKSDFTSLIEPKNTGLSNQPKQAAGFTNRLTQTIIFSSPLKAANLGYSGQHEIINSVLQNQSENSVFLKPYESVSSTASALEKTTKFGITSGFPKSEYVSIFPNFKTENTPYKSTENFTAKAAENQSVILQNLSKQEQNSYLYGKNWNIVFQSLVNQAERSLELVPLKFSPKSSGKPLEISEQKHFQSTFQNTFQNSLQKPCQATPEKSLTTAGIDLDSLLELICSALEEELNTCAEGVHL